MRVLRWTGHSLAAAVFLLSAAVQLNDPDPLRWVILYTVAALLAAAAPLGRAGFRRASGALALLAGAWGAWILSGDLPPLGTSLDPQMKAPGAEQWREGLGLMLIAAYHGLVALWPR